MRALVSVTAMVLVASIAGCRNDASSATVASAPPRAQAATAAPPAATKNLIVRIRKIGGPGGKQVLNQFNVPTPLGDDFSVTEQVGTTQLAFSGKVEDLRDGKYRVRYKYVETSPDGVGQLQSTVELPLDHEEPLGGLLARGGEGGTETVVLSLSRP